MTNREEIARAWGDEIDRRAQRALAGSPGLSREELDELLEMPTQEARAKLDQIIASRR